MDANERVKPPQERKDIPSMMQDMTGERCCSGKFRPAEMCRLMMRSMGTTSNADAASAPGNGEDEAGSCSCGPRSCCGPGRL